MNQNLKDSRVKAIVLDWAGTTVDYGSCAPAGAFVEVFRRKDIRISTAQARGPMGLEKKAHIEELLKLEEISQQWQKNFHRPWNSSDVENLYREFIPIQTSCLKEYSKLIPGVLESVHKIRSQGIKIGSTTGYNQEMIDIVAKEAKIQGFEPDCIICPSQVQSGRPAPWMALEAAHRMQVFPIHSVVKIGDTIADLQEGLNAGMWTIGLAKTGNELGLSEVEALALPTHELQQRLAQATQRLLQAGAHYVVDGLDGVPNLLEAIEHRLKQGEKP